jgi:cell fate regulator YaaT (PSP1 superfamily)
MHDEYARGCPVKNIVPETTQNLKITYSGKLNVFDWLNDIPAGIQKHEVYEVRFKNTRKGYFRNNAGLRLEPGDIVAVEASPGHDIGIVSLCGPLVKHQLRKNRIPLNDELKAIYRKAKPNDIEKWKEAIALEEETMIATRKIANDLKLDMKIGDVEYQGDKTKAIFYYIADERVDFRQLIKVLADRFKIRVEMRQIGARQEAGRIGGIGPCGRELCCSTWVSNFVSVTTGAARYQELSLNPQKLAGQCSKLKCCLNYEVDSYMDARKDFPATDIPLQTTQGRAVHFKTDVHRGMMWYFVEGDGGSNIVPFTVEQLRKYYELNKQGKPAEITIGKQANQAPKIESLDFTNVVGQESLTRFDKDNQRHKRNKKRKPKPQGNHNNQRPNQNTSNKPNTNTNDNQ